MRKIDVWQVAEVVAFCFWRDRDFSLEVMDIKQETPLSQLDNNDFRKKLLRSRWAIDSDVAVPAITVKSKSNNSIHFEDPVKRFGGKTQSDSWFQLISMDAGRTASMIVLAVLLGAAADPRVMLTCDGEEVYDFNICQGKFVGVTRQLAVKDVSAGKESIVLLPRGDRKHEWVTVQTVSGNETCVDLAAAQYGDSSRSECSGVPVVFTPADDFKKRYVEEKRDNNPMMTYSEEFVRMLRCQGQDGRGRLEEFVSVMGKSCALLGLV